MANPKHHRLRFTFNWQTIKLRESYQTWNKINYIKILSKKHTLGLDFQLVNPWYNSGTYVLPVEELTRQIKSR